MIASGRQRVKHGTGRASGWLVVDGTDETLVRKTEFAFKPRTRGQRRKLLALLECTREVYNAGLAERRDAYKHPSQTKISWQDQYKALTTVREVRPEVFAFGLQPLRGALRRVDDAFSGFFDRVKHGETPGYPRFKSRGRFNTLSYPEPVSWSVDLDAKSLYVQGIGDIPLTTSAVRQLKRFAARGGIPKTLTLTRANREGTAWRAAVGYTNIAVERVTAEAEDALPLVGLDRGIAVPVATSTGDLLDFPAEVTARLDDLRVRIEETQRQRSTKKKYSRAWRQLSKKIRRLHGKAARITDNWAKHTAKQLVAQSQVLALEDLNLKSMTRSARGTVEAPGSNVAAKAGLNRALAEVAPGRLAYLVAVKAEEAGRRLWHVPAPYTSQQCSTCGLIDPESRPVRDVFCCTGCGHTTHADANAAVNIAARATAAEAAWAAAGSPLLKRRVAKPRRRKEQLLPAA